MNSSKKKIVFFGTPEFSATCLEQILALEQFEVSLVVTQPDRPRGRGEILSPSPVAEVAAKFKIPTLKPQSIKRTLDDFLKHLSDYGPFDLGVVVAFGQILPIQVLNFPRFASVNVHASLLPRWRGAAPIQRAIMAGDSHSGICLMKMDQGMDTGPVYTSSSIEITADDTFQEVYSKLLDLSCCLLRENLLAIAQGELQAVAQEEQGVTHAKKISKEDTKINWTGSASEIHNFIRGLSPVPACYSTLSDNNEKVRRLKIFRSQIIDDTGANPIPGLVEVPNSGSMIVNCGRGKIELLELQLEGKKRLNVKDFLLGEQGMNNTVLK